MHFDLTKLFPQEDLETKDVLKKAARARRYLAELKGISVSIPNQEIIINTLSIQEARIVLALRTELSPQCGDNWMLKFNNCFSDFIILQILYAEFS